MMQSDSTSVPDAYLILLPNDTVFTIVAVTRAFEKITSTGRDRILGRGFFELFPPSRNENSGNNVRASRHRAPCTGNHAPHEV